MPSTQITIASSDRDTALLQGATELDVAVEALEVEDLGDGQFRVFLKEPPGSFKIFILPDKITVLLKEITPPTGSAASITAQDILKQLADQKVVFGIDSEAIERVCADVEATRTTRTDVLIAFGKAAIKGTDARVDFQIGLNAPHKNSEIAQIVKPGMVLAVKTLATPGEPGKNVFGEELPAAAGADYAFSAGTNVTVSKDNLSFLATIYGRVMPKRDTISVFSLVEISENAMSASIDLYPVVADNSRLSLEDVQTSLKEAGVVQGINEETITSALQGEEPQLHVVVAEGHGARDGVDAAVEFFFRLNNDDPLAIDALRQQDGIDETTLVKELVIAGQVLARKTPAVPAIDGYTVTGNPSAGNPPADKTITAGPGVTVHEDGLTFEAAAELPAGYANCIHGALTIEDPLRVSEDNMRVFLTIHPPGGTHRLTEELVGRLLIYHKITHGASRKATQKALEFAATRKTPLHDVLIAKGTPPLRGQDAKIEFTVNFGTCAGQTSAKADLMNYRERGLIHNIKEGTVVATKAPAQPGVPGKDVFGHEIEAAPGEDLTLVPLENITVSEDGLTFTASIDGMISLVPPDKIGVFKQYEVKGDVDYSTGNLTMDGVLDIKGWVKTGFSVRASGDIQVGGGVEESSIEGGTHVLISGGVVGGENGKIKARGDVSALFLERAHINAGNNVFITNDIMRSKVFAGGIVTAVIGKGRIRGGIISAVKGIEANELGSEASIKTVIMAGVDIKTRRRLAKIKKQALDYRRQKAKMDTVLSHFAGKGKNVKLPADVARKVALLVKKRREMVSTEEKLAKLMKTLLAQLAAIDLKTIRVVAHKAVYVGTSVIIGRQVFKVVEDLAGPVSFGINEEGHVEIIK